MNHHCSVCTAFHTLLHYIAFHLLHRPYSFIFLYNTHFRKSECNCFTTLHESLLYNEVNQLYVYIYPLPPGSPSHPQPHPTPLGHHRAPSWAPCAMQELPTSFYFTHGSVYMSIPISHFIPPSPFPPCPKVHSLHLCLYSYPANRFISTILLILYTCVNIQCFSLLTYFTLYDRL